MNRFRLASLILSIAAVAGTMRPPVVLAADGRPDGDPAGALKVPLDTSILQRVVWSHDFDEPNNPGNFPKQSWVRIGDVKNQNRHFPLWNPVGFVPADPVPGEKIDRHFRLETRGGSTGMRVVAGVIPALPHTDYMVRIDARTLGLNNARGRVIAAFLDTSGDLIQQSVQMSRPVLTSNDWETIGIVLEGDYDQAAWIEIQLLLQQPDQWMSSQPFGQEVRREDLSGSIDFDDLYVWRLPRVDLYTTQTNVVIGSGPVEIAANLLDVAHKGLVGRLRTYDLDGRLIDEQSAPVTPGGGPTLFQVPVARFGWYRSLLTIAEKGAPISNTSVDFAVIPEDDPGSAARAVHFGVVADEREPRSHQNLSEYLNALHVSNITLSLWPRSLKPAGVRSYLDELEPIIADLSEHQLQPTFAVNVVPDAMTTDTGLNQHKVYATMSGTNEVFWDALDEFLIDFGQLVPRWQVGPSGGASLFHLRSIDDGLATIGNRIGELVPQPVMVLPWTTDQELPAPDMLDPESAANRFQTRREFIVRVPGHIDSGSVDDYLRPWVEREVSFATVVEPLNALDYGYRDAVIDLVKRTVSAAESGAKRLMIPQPWREDDVRRPRIMPTHLFPAWRTLATHLDDCEPAGRLRLLEGIEAVIFRRDTGEGTIVIWNDSLESESYNSRINWGEQPIRVVDPFGNEIPVERIDGEHHFPIGRLPLFIEGADINLVLFMASLNISPRVVESSAKVQEHEIIIGNPWDTTIHGEITIVEPSHWEIRPLVRSFTVPAGELHRTPVRFVLPTYELAGEHILVLEAKFQANRFMQSRVRIPLEVGHERVVLNPSYRFEPGDNDTTDLVVVCDVSNNSEQPAWVTAFAVGEGSSRKEADITNLEPRESTRRIFRFPNAARLRGTTMRIGLQEIDGPGRLNLLMPID